MKRRLSMRLFSILALCAALIILPGLLTACGPNTQAQSGAPDRLQVVATTTIVADVVRQMGGEHVSVTSLVPMEADTHAYQPSPRDVVQVSEADLLFINGAGLETFLEQMLESANERATLVSVSEGIELLESHEHEEHDEGQEEHGEAGHIHEEGDPHTWTDPNNVLVWVDNIERALVEADPDHAAEYQQNAKSYRQELQELDAWVREQVQPVSPERRLLVTDHLVFSYFAERYGFEQVGAVIPGYSTLSSPSAQQLAELEDHIRTLGVPAIFVGNTASTTLSERVAQDLGVEIVTVITGSLTPEDGPAPTYIDYIRYNTSVITDALK